jgi:trehalose-phosphatase
MDWDKGKAVLWLLDKYDTDNAVSIYIGDSLTDEDAFKALKGKGITVRVGKSNRSLADCYVHQQAEVITLLREIIPGKKN